MSTWTRLAVRFARDSVFDGPALYEHLGLTYRLGYMGVYDCGTHTSVYLQTAAKDVRMSPKKVYRICREFGALTLPQTFKHRYGVVVSDYGVFRKGGNSKKEISASNARVRIHAVGEEDVSHITMQQLKRVLGGEKSDILQRMRAKLSTAERDRIVDEAWGGLQQMLYASQVCGLDCDEQHHDPESPVMTPLKYQALGVGGQPIKYDGDPGSEYNTEAKKKVATIAILELSAVEKAYDLPHEFAKLLYANPRNINVEHPTKAGYIRCFNGESWVHKETLRVHDIVETWRKKARESFHLLKAKHGAEWEDTFSGCYAMQVLCFFDYQHPRFLDHAKYLNTRAKRCALLAIENAGKM